MSLDPTIREANFRDSIIKHFVDNVESALSIPVLFDRELITPKIQGREVDTWCAVYFGGMEIDSVTKHQITFNSCSKMDNEGFKLAQTRDKIMGTFFDPSYPNNVIPTILYRSYPAPTEWAIIARMLPYLIWESGINKAEDGTKFKSSLIEFRWGAKG